MRTLNRYIFWDYLIIFLAALGLITFVMTIGAVVKAIDLMARGISPMLLARFFLQNVPYILSFSMPISTLFATLLLFGRLSMDNEISAMKACGISLWRLAAPLILASIFFTAICVYINSEVAPVAKHANRELLRNAGVEEPLNLLEEGRFIHDFPGLMIYVGRKNGAEVKDVVAYELDPEGTVKRSVRAKHGTIEPDNENRLLRVKLYDVRIEMPDAADPNDVSKTTYVNAEYYPVKLDFEEMLKGGSGPMKRGHMTLSSLMDLTRYARRIAPMTPEERLVEEKKNDGDRLYFDYQVESGDLSFKKQLALFTTRRMLLQLKPEDLEIEASRMSIEANSRVSIAIGCFTFMLIGIPLGVKSHRKETSVGMILSLGVVFAYYIFIVIAKALAEYPWIHPDLFLWIPLVVAQILGFRLIRRAS